ncbi:membrane protein of ER body-like protein isoform X3 [Vigna unguiculata]|uniref:membrane protein of ER body-like protein isoform X3 n=1 Tax=Vigna unguiculata TaxID=3917 RepID=UPI0010160118|nr:membrane protein of ER body-like protein isoform X3 [Vigna unguiculata]
MEQLYCAVREDEEEEEEQLQDGAALKGRQSLQQGKDGSITNAEAPSFFSSVKEQPFPQKEEVLHTHKELRVQPAQKVEEKHNGVAENGKNFNGDSEKVGIGIIADIVENAINGEVLSSATINADASHHENSVYFDKQQGMWKCHHCAWTKQFDSPWNLRHGNLNGYSELLMNVKTMIQHGPCFVCETKGNNIDGAKSALPKSLEEEDFGILVENSDIQCSPYNGINNMEIVEERVPSSVAELPSPNSSEIQGAATVDNFGDESSAKTYPNLTEEIDQQLKEFDVEAVLAKQETHDLFCPNCKSCITKRVILRKRKRTTPIPNLDTKAKRDKSAIEIVDSSVDEGNLGDHAIATPDDAGRVEPPAENFEPEREPEVFRCLSCFSFFVPMRNGFKLFPSFGGKPEASQKLPVIPASNVENPSIVAASNSNWFFTLFTSIKGRKASAQGDASIEDSRTDPASIEDSRIDNPESSPANTPISHGGVNSSIPSIVKSVVKIESWIEKGKKSNVALQNETLVEQNDSHTQNSSDVEDINRDSVVVIKTDAVADITKRDSVLLATVATTENVREKNHDPVDVIKTDVIADIPKPDGVLVATVATTEVLFNAAGKPSKDAILKPYEGSSIFDKTLETAQDSYSSLMKEAQSPEQSFGSEVVANDVARDKQNFIVNGSIPSIQDFKKVETGIEDEIKPSVAKEKEEAFETSTSQATDVPTEGAIVTETLTHTEIYIGEQPRAEVGEHQEWEILKSIVYGGLVESITSLGVVSSAASSGAAPLNIIALGLANIIGGLFVIGHNLIDLKNGHSERNPSQDRYEELLGRRENFTLHAFLAVLSFIIFGSVPLGVYGLFISKHYYDEDNIAAVTATSVVCIILLAMGKAYTTTQPKSYVKTVLHYVGLALATSGMSYIAGDLVKDLLDKIIGSESGYVLAMPLSDTTTMEPA